MKDLVTVTTRITKDLKERVNGFAKNNNVKTQVIYKVALNEFLEKYKDSEGKSETTLFLENKIDQYAKNNDDISRELIGDLIYIIEENNINVDQYVNRLITKYKSNKEIIESSLLLREESLR